MKKNGKAREYNMKGGDTPRADLRPILVDALIQEQGGNIDRPIMDFVPVIKGVARGYKSRVRKSKSKKSKK